MPKSPPKSYLQKKEQAPPKRSFGTKLLEELEKRSVAYLIGGAFLLLGVGTAILIDATNAGKDIRAWIPGIPEGPETREFAIDGRLTDLKAVPLSNLTVLLSEYEGPGDKTDRNGYFYLKPELPENLKKVTLLILDNDGIQIYATDFALLENDLPSDQIQTIVLPDENIAHLEFAR